MFKSAMTKPWQKLLIRCGKNEVRMEKKDNHNHRSFVLEDLEALGKLEDSVAIRSIQFSLLHLYIRLMNSNSFPFFQIIICLGQAGASFENCHIHVKYIPSVALALQYWVLNGGANVSSSREKPAINLDINRHNLCRYRSLVRTGSFSGGGKGEKTHFPIFPGSARLLLTSPPARTKKWKRPLRRRESLSHFSSNHVACRRLETPVSPNSGLCARRFYPMELRPQ